MSNNLTEKLNDSLEDKVDRLIVAVQSMDSRLESVESRLDSMDARIEGLETKVGNRLRETQPIWEAVQARLAEIRESQQRQGEDIAALRADTEKGFRTLDRRMERQIGEFERLHAYQRDLEDRVDKIEKLSTP